MVPRPFSKFPGTRSTAFTAGIDLQNHEKQETRTADCFQYNTEYVHRTQYPIYSTDRLGTRLPVIARRSRELVLAAQELVAAAKLYNKLGGTDFRTGAGQEKGQKMMFCFV